jgi:hypothetical protein
MCPPSAAATEGEDILTIDHAVTLDGKSSSINTVLPRPEEDLHVGR